MNWRIASSAGVGPGPVRIGAMGQPEHGTVLFVPGRGDSLELREAVASRIAAAFGVEVVMPEHHGQGGSGHLGREPDAVHVDDFGIHLDVLRRLVPAGEVAAPRYLLSHSMGGLLALHLLAERAGEFAGAVFLSPMWGFAGPLPRSLVSLVARAMTAFGRGTDYAMGERAFDLETCLDMRTDDEPTRRRLTDFAAQHRTLVRGGSTWQWVRAAAAAMGALDWLPIEAIPTPTLIVSPAQDTTVSRRVQRRVAKRFSNAAYVEVPGRHDVLSGGRQTMSMLWGLLGRILAGGRGTS